MGEFTIGDGFRGYGMLRPASWVAPEPSAGSRPCTLPTVEFVAEYDEPYYDSLNALPKIVFSSTLQEPLGWSNSTVISEDAVTAMARLKRETDRPMRAHGSISLNRALLAAGLVDFLEVTVFPAITGSAGYAALFRDGPEFDLASAHALPVSHRRMRCLSPAP